MRHTGHARLALRVVDRRVRHVSIAVRMLSGRSSEVGSRGGSGIHLRLGSVTSGDERDTIDGRRGRRGVSVQLWERRLTLRLVVRGDHLGFNGAFMAVRWCGVTIFVVVVFAAIEVRRTFVLIWPTMLRYDFSSVCLLRPAI